MTSKELQGIIDQEVEKAKSYFDELEIQVHSTMELENATVANLLPLARLGALTYDAPMGMVIQEPKEQTAHSIDEAIVANKKIINGLIGIIKQRMKYIRVKPNLPPMEENK